MKRGASVINAYKTLPKSMKIALGVSVFMHVGIFVLGVVGMPHIKKPIVIPDDPISVEIIDISELRTATKPPQKTPPKEEKPVEPPKVKEEIKTPPKVEAKEPPKVRPLDKPADPIEEDIQPPKPDTPPPPDEVALTKPQPSKKPEPPKKEAVEKTVSEEDFLSVLKNLQDSEPTEKTSDQGDEKVSPEESPLAKFADKLSATELDMIARVLNIQFASCWNLMAGARYAEDIVVSINLKVNPDRTIQSARIADQWRYNQDSFYRAAADTALRAVRHPNCETLDLPADKYELWKDLTFNFNPSTQL